MNVLRKAVSATKFFSSLSGVGIASEGILGDVASVVCSYYDSVGVLLEKITMQSEIVTSAAQAYVDQDADIARNVPVGTIEESNLIDGIQLLNN